MADCYHNKARYGFSGYFCKLMIRPLFFCLAILFFSANNTSAQTVHVRHTKTALTPLPQTHDENEGLGRAVIEFDITSPPVSADAIPKAGRSTPFEDLDRSARPGEPLLPYYALRVLLPADADLSTVRTRLKAAHWQDLPGQYEIPPAPPAATWHAGKYIFDWAGKDSSLIVAGRDTSVYDKDDYFPPEPVEVVSVGKFRQWKLAELRIWLNAYNPVQKKLRALAGGTAEISVALAPYPANALAQSLLLPQLLSATVNSQDYDKFYTPPAPAAGPATDYVIITTSLIRDTTTKLAAFIVSKENCGHTVKVVTQAASADDTHYVSGTTADQRADNIRDWLQAHYLTDGIEYLLLIGDPHPATFDTSTSIPMKMCYPRHGAPDGYEEAPSDMFFAELTGTWDYDADGYFGEYTGDYRAGGADKDCELRVGRIPFYGSYTDLDAFLQKTIDYSSETGDRAWRDKVLIAAAVSNFAPQDEDGNGTADSPFLIAADRTFGDDWGQEIKSVASSQGFEAYTLYENEGIYSDGSAYPLTACDSPLTVNNFASEWQNQYGFVTWWGHGNETTAYRFCWTNDSAYPNVTGNHPGHDETTWYTLFSTSYVSQLDDTHPSFVVPIACEIAHPENSNNLAHRLLKNGAIGTFAGTRVTWYAVGSWDPGIGLTYADNGSHAYYIFDRMAANNDTAAAALNWCRTNFGTGWASSSWMNMVGINLYGDPAISMTTACLASTPPDANSVAVSTSVNLPVTIGLQATDDGLPDPPDALSYIITSLPGHGTLTDPQGGAIEAVQYELLDNGNEVIYEPNRSYLGSDQFDFIAYDGGLPPTGGDSNEATVSITVVQYFTELFDEPGNDLDSRTFTFIPDGSVRFYTLCRDDAAQFPTDPNGGLPLALGDDDSMQLSLTGGKQVGVYGSTFGSFWIGSNGYITFDAADIDSTESVGDHFAMKRISALFDDLDPSAGGQISWKQLTDRAVVTFLNVPEAGTANSNSFQIEMFFEGTIRLTYLNIDAADGLAGLSDGAGRPADFATTDFSACALCADFNDDNNVNITDFVMLNSYWFDENCPNTVWCNGTDLDRSTQVDIFDVDSFFQYWLVQDNPAEIEKTFTSIASHDGRVYDIDGDGIGDGANSDTGGESLRLGDLSDHTAYRSIVSFDTSSIPADAIIISATLQLTCGSVEGTSPYGWGGACNVDIASPWFYTSADLQGQDYNGAADVYSIANFTQDPTVGQAITSTDFKAQGLRNINKDGTTQLRVYFDTPTNDNEVEDYLGFYSAKTTLLERHPVLAVRYTTLTPTLTFYSTAAEDGRVYDDGAGIEGAGSSTGDSGSNSLKLGDYSGGQSYRSILSFDTSSIPPHYSIESAKVEITRGAQSGLDPFIELGTCNIDIAKPSFGAVALEDSDWQAAGDAVAVATFPADPGSGNPMTSSDFNSAGLANINKNGTTQLKVYFTDLNNGDTVSDYRGFYSGEAVQAKQPKLIIQCSVN